MKSGLSSAGWLVGMLATLVLSTSSAFAADMPLKAPPPVQVAYDWSGFYIGGHVGGGWENTTFTDPGAFSILNNCCAFLNEQNVPGAASDAQGNAFLGGAQAGWMYQIGRYVVGADIDFSSMRVTGAGGRAFPPVIGFPTTFINENYTAQTDWTATSTATFGYAHGPWLVYGKAGLAWEKETYGLSLNGSESGTAFSFSSSTSQLVSGWTTGIGVKWALSDHLFLNAEYDFLDFGLRAQHLNGNLTATPAIFGGTNTAANFDPNFEQNISELKVGLNYKFTPGGFGSTAASPMLTKAPAASTVYDWSGPYIGVHIGGGWQNVTFSDPSAMSVLSNCCILLGTIGDPTAASDGRGSGFLGGAQAGWAYQVGHLVVGGDVDISGTDIRASGGSSWPALTAGSQFANETYSVRTNWTATSTATVGVAEGVWQFYGKVGSAWADNTYGLNVAGSGGAFGGGGTPFSFSSSTNQIVVGWTAGIGFKWALTNNLFLNAEYDYLDFGSQVQHISGILPPINPSPGIPGPVSSAVNFDPLFNQNISEIKVGLNYKFASSGPVDLIVPSTAARTKYDWSGLYVGGHIGGGWQNTTFSDPGAYSIIANCCVMISGANYPTAASDANGFGVLGGVQAGWMHQIDRLVVGADFDFSGTSMNGSGSSIASAVPTGTYFYNESYSVRSKWTQTSTATVGIASGTWLFYGKAGAAFVDNSYSLSITGAGNQFGTGTPFSFASSTDKIAVGWTSGIGVKWALSNDLFVNAEYDFLDFGSLTQTFNGTFSATPTAFLATGSAGTFQPTYNQMISEFKVGLNYKFGTGLPF